MKFLFLTLLGFVSLNVYGYAICQTSAFGDPLILEAYPLTTEADVSLPKPVRLTGEQTITYLMFSEMKVWELYIDCLKHENSSAEEIQNAEKHLNRLKRQLFIRLNPLEEVDPAIKVDPLIE